MKRIQIPHTDLTVSPLGLGTGNYGAGISIADAARQMDKFLDAGGNLIDTAHVYNDWVPGPRGRSEIVIGDYIKKRGNRSRIVLSTKGAHPRLDTMHIPRCTPKDITQDITESLANLKMDTIDLYFLHRDDPNVPIADIAGCLENEVQKGRIRYYGCSNWTLKRMEEMAAHAREAGLTGFVVNQTMWSLADVTFDAVGDKTLVPFDRAMWDYHRDTGMAAMAYTSTAGGYFAKKAAGRDVSERQQRVYGNPANKVIERELARISNESGVPVLMLTLLYFAAQPFAAIPLTSFSNEEQLTETLAYLTEEYPTELVAALGAHKLFVTPAAP